MVPLLLMAGSDVVAASSPSTPLVAMTLPPPTLFLPPSVSSPIMSIIADQAGVSGTGGSRVCPPSPSVGFPPLQLPSVGFPPHSVPGVTAGFSPWASIVPTVPISLFGTSLGALPYTPLHSVPTSCFGFDSSFTSPHTSGLPLLPSNI